jgi:hypothetical protein
MGGGGVWSDWPRTADLRACIRELLISTQGGLRHRYAVRDGGKGGGTDPDTRCVALDTGDVLAGHVLSHGLDTDNRGRCCRLV